MSEYDNAPSSGARFYAVRLKPGQDVVKELRAFVDANNLKAVSIVSVVGSLNTALLRYANTGVWSEVSGHFEIVSLVGTIDEKGEHLHISLSDRTGQTIGAHFGVGSAVYTTAEITLAEFPDLSFRRELCPQSGWEELTVEGRQAS
ncbi:putative DNA-binding protein with PD1-like motif [Pararhizobium capsulatum DSM 1112]|uniref:DNA-binding protein with PD1-like motif n=1 Tax=Pararhizobium capsulatum DSM 1112 TaxID=1121113 RepID=A0ABU0BUR6_9HYPH|nr:PPC domain-containing DNA-binding protein [Pararhizobium capsulatum]MDQ0321988.1 putative DNA-binding protein with PD1-like motif [Pararhizobium capsulatum DSM 1112]